METNGKGLTIERRVFFKLIQYNPPGQESVSSPLNSSSPGPTGAARRERGSLYRDIARDILRFGGREQWAVGAPVREQALARRLGVSRTPVRRALRLLADEGVVVHEAGVGFKLSVRLDGGCDLLDRETGPGETLPGDDADLCTRILSDRGRGRLQVEVSESGLVQRYGKTRGLVRKALQLLAADGLVRRQRGHGWRFTDSLDTDEAIAESYAFRVGVECAALQQPGYRADPVELARLRSAHEALLARPAEEVTRQQWFWVNATFHEALAAWSNNRFFLQAIRHQNSLRRMQQYVDFPALTPAQIEQSCREHLGVLDAIDEGDFGIAQRRLAHHLTAAARD